MKGLTGIGKFLLISFLMLSLTSCSILPISKTVTEPSKETIEVLVEASRLANSIKFKDARKLLEDKYDLIKDYDKGLNSYGLMEFHIFENYEKAEELYERAIELNPKNSNHYIGIGNLYKTKGEYKKAIKYYEKAIKETANYDNVPLNPELASLYKEIGEAYLKLNDTTKAIETLEKAVENNPFSIEANAILHKLYVKQEDYQKAYTIWKNDNLVNESGDHVFKGILEWNKLYKEAVENNSEILHQKMGKLYEELVLYDEAVIEYEKAYNLDQTNEYIKNKLYEINSYVAFRDELQLILDDYYRQRSINGVKEELTFYIRIKPAYEKIAPLFPKIDDKSVSNATWIDTLNKEIEKKFSVRIENIRANSSMLGLHFGRIIDNSMIHSSLWGEEIELKVITLKNMISNGLDYWISMENWGVGGWSISPTEVVRVIQDTANDGGLKLASLYNEDVREDYIKEIGNIKIDIEEKEPLELFYSPDIQTQFTVRQINIEIEKARSEGISDNEFQSYLFDKFEKDFAIKTTIYIHESQHSIDNKIGFKMNWFGEHEYRPKMSQLAYGSMPFLSLNQFYSSSIGMEVKDSHIRANTEVFKDIVQYVYVNHNKFPQINIKENILAQLIKLSEDDLKVIAINIFEKKYGVK